MKLTRINKTLCVLSLAGLLAPPLSALASKDAKIAVASTFTSMDPYDISDTLTQNAIRSFYEGLFRLDKDLKLKPVLAEEYDVSPDGLVYTFKLKKGVKFHDGTDFNAAAVKANFDRVTDTNNHLKRYILFRNIDKTEPIDDYTVRVTLKEPFSAFINQLAHPSAAMISPKALEKGNKYVAFNPVGTGPFVFEEWKATDYLKGKKNENYWKPGYPKIDTITFIPVVDNNTRAAMLQTGEADMIDPVPFEQVKVLEGKKGIEVVTSPSIIQRYMSMNMLQKPFDNPKVRQALNMAINKEALAKVAFNGYAIPSNSYV
ncbi:MAG: ABC transporter substrate-binding protein, partial [Burkholderiales bacterium]|nr:ABC transporter substrate-binding protein [Burkholderiales bacterium]